VAQGHHTNPNPAARQPTRVLPLTCMQPPHLAWKVIWEVLPQAVAATTSGSQGQAQAQAQCCHQHKPKANTANKANLDPRPKPTPRRRQRQWGTRTSIACGYWQAMEGRFSVFVQSATSSSQGLRTATS